jgi:4-hydroxyphenylpyruvate dioxygenase
MDFLDIKGIDYVELYVGNAFQSANFYCQTLGFVPIAYAGPDTNITDRSSFVIAQGDIKLILTGAVTPDSSIADHVAIHGDGVKDIAFRVEDAARAFDEVTSRGAYPILEPTVYEEGDNQIIKATVAAFGDTVHTFVQRKPHDSKFFPYYHPIKNSVRRVNARLTAIDHIAICVEAGNLEHYSNYYEQGMGFHESFRLNIGNKLNGMNSRVVEDASGLAKLVICEPSSAKAQSQIQEYLKYYGGSGVQHLAFASTNILESVRTIETNGLQFLRHPDPYYEMLPDRIGQIDEDLAVLQELGILADRDERGYLLQAFTKVLQDRPTFFLEVIQRHGTQSFGQGNIEALFEAVKVEQAKRSLLAESA